MERNYQEYVALIDRFGPSFYLLDLGRLRTNIRGFQDAFLSHYPRSAFSYSYKTNYTPQVCQAAMLEGWMAEVVSEMEFDLACEFGNNPTEIIVNGPIKSSNELQKYFALGSTVHLDSMAEVRTAVGLAEADRSRTVRVGLRCNFECGNYISRFGLDVESGDLDEAIGLLQNLPNVELVGLHCHFPDRDLGSFRTRASTLASLAKTRAIESLEYIDIGGGFFGEMDESLADQFTTEIPTIADYAHEISSILRSAELDSQLTLLVEPGTAIVANTMSFVSQICNVKTVRGKTFGEVAGSRFNLGNISSKLNLPLTVMGSDHTERVTYENADIVGYTCIEGDVLYRGYSGPLNAGDIAIFGNAGSYSVVFKPPFIRPNVPIVTYDSDRPELPATIAKRLERAKDILVTYEGY